MTTCTWPWLHGRGNIGRRSGFCRQEAEWSGHRNRSRLDAAQGYSPNDIPTTSGLPHFHCCSHFDSIKTLIGSEPSLSNCPWKCFQGHTKVCLTSHVDVSQSHQVRNHDLPSQEFRYLFLCLLACSQINGWTICPELMLTVPLMPCLEQY